MNSSSVYLFMYETQKQRDAETQAEREAGSLRGAWCRTRSQDPRIMPWAGQMLNHWATQVPHTTFLKLKGRLRQWLSLWLHISINRGASRNKTPNRTTSSWPELYQNLLHLALWVDLLVTQGFTTSCIHHLEIVTSRSHEDLPNFDIFHYSVLRSHIC